MLEKPDLPDQLIISRVEDEYRLQVEQITFLPLGADVNTAVYRAVTEDGKAYFLKLRKEPFDEMAVAVPQFLKSQGIQAIIAPIETRKQRPWGSLEVYRMILYPFIQGRDAYQVILSDPQWLDFGEALKGIHTAHIPAGLKKLIQRETYSPQWRELVRTFQEMAENSSFDDPVAAKTAELMKTEQEKISHMVHRAGELGLALQERQMEFVLCHSDIHPGNLLIEEGEKNRLYIVDWDNPILAPKERDLMFIGAGMGNGIPGGREEAMFYRGYGQVEIDPEALAYYRYERIVQDIAEFCKQLLLSDEGSEDREQSYRYLSGQFLPDHEIDVAYQTDRRRVRFSWR